MSQSPGPIPVVASFAGDSYYRHRQCGLHRQPSRGDPADDRTGQRALQRIDAVSGTLLNTYTNQPMPNEPVTLTLSGTQSCTATTNASGMASCTITPNEPAGSYSTTGTFTGRFEPDAPAPAD